MRGILAWTAVATTVIGPATLAAPITADKMLVASTPQWDASVDAPVESISLQFAETAHLLSLSLTGPDGNTLDVYQQSYEKGAPQKKGQEFAFTLSPTVIQPGDYTLSYLLTSKSFPSLNGFVHFALAGAAAVTDDVPVSDVIAPDLIETQPAESSTVDAPVADILMRFGSPVRLIEATLITPDQRQIALVAKTTAGNAEESSVFVLPFLEGQTLPGTYLVDYTVHQKDAEGAWFQTSAFTSFTIGSAE